MRISWSPGEEKHDVRIHTGGVVLAGELGIPAGARGVVLFAHGSGSGRLSPRNQFVAQVLRNAGFATLLLDLLTADEEQVDRFTAHLRFDVGLLADRLVGAAGWLADEASVAGLPIGLFGASTGGGAAIRAAAARPDLFRAVVSRGGRPDLAGEALRRLATPTLLIVGGRDDAVMALNEQAAAEILAPKRLAVVPGATHLFEEPGALPEVARMAADWFAHHLAGREATW